MDAIYDVRMSPRCVTLRAVVDDRLYHVDPAADLRSLPGRPVDVNLASANYPGFLLGPGPL